MSRSNKPWVYIAGPYTIGNQTINVRNAILMGDFMIEMGVMPIVPHLDLLWDFVVPREPEFWYEYTLEIMKRCDAVFRIPGESKGADDEVAYAKAHGIPVFESGTEFIAWLERWKREEQFSD